MIEGLHFDFTTDELADVLKERIRYHESRKRFYEDRKRTLEDAGVGRSSAHMSSGTNDPVVEAEAGITRHDTKIKEFTILHDHLVPEEVYRLDKLQLQNLGVIPGRF